MTSRWTLGQVKEQGHFLYLGCRRITALQLLDLDELISRFGADFDILGTQLEDRLDCPCGGVDHRPAIGVGEAGHLAEPRKKGGEPGGAHSLSHATTTVEESARHQVELNRRARETNARERQRHEQLQHELAEIRAKMARRRARNPYDFT